MSHVEIMAEVGSNFDGSLETARAYVKAARERGATGIKFQTLCREKLVAPRIWSGGAWVDNAVYHNFSNLGIPDEWHAPLKEQADSLGIEFISTPFHLKAVEVMEVAGVRSYKIASGDISFFPLLKAVGRTGKRVILSTGASSLGDVERALDTLVRAGAKQIVLLHCVANYPPRYEEMNLRALVTLREAFGLPVGISDHSPGDLVPLAAVVLGAVMVEKHVTFDRALPGPDHPFAMTWEEFGEMAGRVRLLELALGTGRKAPTETERAKQHRLRRGVYDPITLEPTGDPHGLWLRPQHGLVPLRLDE